jgi:hypothetical protein
MKRAFVIFTIIFLLSSFSQAGTVIVPTATIAPTATTAPTRWSLAAPSLRVSLLSALAESYDEKIIISPKYSGDILFDL